MGKIDGNKARRQKARWGFKDWCVRRLGRFDNKTHRIYGVMNLGLFNKRYLATGQYTIADLICFPWASSWSSRKIDIEEFSNVKSWLAEIGERPAVKKAVAMGP